MVAEYYQDGNLIDNYVYLGRLRLARFNDDLLNNPRPEWWLPPQVYHNDHPIWAQMRLGSARAITNETGAIK